MRIIPAIIGSLTLIAGLSQPTMAQEPLSVGGETIIDGKTFSTAKEEGRLVHYGTFPADSMKIIHQAFQTDTGIRVEYVRMSTAPLFQRISAEADAKRLEADFVDLTDVVMIEDLVSKGVLTVPHKVPSFEAIPATLKDPQGRWYSFINPISAIGINTARLKGEPPKTWADLADPRFKGQIGIINIDGGSALSMYKFFKVKLGDDFWNKLKANTPRMYDSVAPQAADLARGDIAVAIGAVSETVIAQIKAGAPLRVIFPTEGLPAFPIAGGITAGAKRPNAAATFLNWVTSKRGGDVVASALAYSTNPASATPGGEGHAYPPRDQIWYIDPADWKANQAKDRAEFRALFGGR